MLLLFTSCCALSVLQEEVRSPQGWVKGQVVPHDIELDFTFALKHSEQAKTWLAKTVQKVSNPANKEYGMYMSALDIKGKLGAGPDQIDDVVSSLVKGGFTGIAVLPSADFVRAAATAGKAAAYFRTEMCYWKSSAGTIIRACDLQYHLSPEVSAAVDIVAGLVHFPTPSTKGTGINSVDSGDENFVQTLRETYNLAGVKPQAGKASVAFTQFLGQLYSPADLQTFLGHYAPDQKGQTIVKKMGPATPGNGIEAELDSQYLVAMGAGLPTWSWTNLAQNSVNNQEPWVEFFTNVSNSLDVPNLFSISYGEGENTLTPAYIQRSDVELQKIAARGITVLSSSGDNGAACSHGEYVANFPASLPHITAVGATGTCQKGSGVAGFSSGGFSRSYPMQAWQKAAVMGYLNKTAILPPASVFNASGRGYPDVAACGSVSICVGGGFMMVSGTSCSCPIFAGVLGLIIDARLAAGKAALGFVAPALYAAHAADNTVFNDVTSGASFGGCGGGDGWKAAPGWDPVTGLGTPNYQKLLAALK
eukprot:TRINITY_DN3393_c0_g5_i1.p1 TRINITY_DN3393_c0_g5~~TRINITY_DN3393_c0_g5_i1.p1  ORF type:complete len:534 (+),score=156.77 TRINITY_DN3393_c0_g5_i1:49-1650(+)